MGGWRCGYLRRSREGSDYTTINLYFVSHVFQSTLPRRERRPANGRFRCAPPHFNPRSREGSDSVLLHLRTSHSDFNPRSREGSDIRSGRGGQAVAHFNPRSREGSDAYSSAFWRVITNFNPRSREGSDAVRHARRRRVDISIHAPAKGATRHSRKRPSHTRFQSTLPRRERPSSGAFVITPLHFNPRSREGSDGSNPDAFQQRILFQSTLPRRERLELSSPTLLDTKSISIHAPAKGATDYFFIQLAQSKISIHAPAKGATRSARWRSCSPHHFNPRSREGSDHTCRP